MQAGVRAAMSQLDCGAAGLRNSKLHIKEKPTLSFGYTQILPPPAEGFGCGMSNLQLWQHKEGLRETSDDAALKPSSPSQQLQQLHAPPQQLQSVVTKVTAEMQQMHEKSRLSQCNQLPRYTPVEKIKADVLQERFNKIENQIEQIKKKIEIGLRNIKVLKNENLKLQNVIFKQKDNKQISSKEDVKVLKTKLKTLEEELKQFLVQTDEEKEQRICAQVPVKKMKLDVEAPLKLEIQERSAAKSALRVDNTRLLQSPRRSCTVTATSCTVSAVPASSDQAMGAVKREQLEQLEQKPATFQVQKILSVKPEYQNRSNLNPCDPSVQTEIQKCPVCLKKMKFNENFHLHTLMQHSQVKKRFVYGPKRKW